MTDEFDPTQIDLQAAFGGGDEEPELDRQQAEAMAKELAEARQRLLDTPVADVVVNHGIGLYELAAIHLSAPKPDFDQARLAIDALKAIVERLAGRLGEGEKVLADAVNSLQMAFVQRLGEQERE